MKVISKQEFMNFNIQYNDKIEYPTANQICKAALNAWTLCTLKGRELDAILRYSQATLWDVSISQQKMTNGRMHVPEIHLCDLQSISCTRPNVYEKSVFKPILLYTDMLGVLFKQLVPFSL